MTATEVRGLVDTYGWANIRRVAALVRRSGWTHGAAAADVGADPADVPRMLAAAAWAESADSRRPARMRRDGRA